MDSLSSSLELPPLVFVGEVMSFNLEFVLEVLISKFSCDTVLGSMWCDA